MKMTDVILRDGMLMQVKGSRATVLQAIRDERNYMGGWGLLDVEIHHRNLDGSIGELTLVSIDVNAVVFVGSDREWNEGKDALASPPYVDVWEDNTVAKATI